MRITCNCVATLRVKRIRRRIGIGVAGREALIAEAEIPVGDEVARSLSRACGHCARQSGTEKMQLFHDQSAPNVGESSRPVKLASRWPSDATRHTQ